MAVVVVGGGIVGASAMYHLTRLGVDCQLVDQPRPGVATSAGIGVVFPWLGPGGPPVWQRIRSEAADYWPTLIEDLEAGGFRDHGYAQVGALSLADSEDELAEMDRGLRWLRDQPGMSGIGEIQTLGPDEVATRVPVLRSGLMGLYASGVGRLDGSRMVAALRAAAQARGGRWITGYASLLFHNGAVDAVRVDGDGALAADAVVVAGGAWSAEVIRACCLDLPVRPERGQAVHLQMPWPAGGARGHALWPVVRASDEQYLVDLGNGRIAVGATREPSAGFNTSSTAKGVHDVLAAALEFAPGLAEASVSLTCVGLRPTSLDGLPIFGSLHGASNVVVATGLGGSGLTFGPYLGSLAANMAAAGGRPGTFTELSPDRLIRTPA